MSFPERNIKMTVWRKFSHLKGVPLINIENEKPLLLIGQGNIDLVFAI